MLSDMRRLRENAQKRLVFMQKLSNQCQQVLY
jgi:hypothetical protein